MELGGDADVAFDHAEQRAVDNCSDDLLLRHGPFLAGWRVTFAFPLTFPHLDHFHMTSKVGRVLFRVGQKHRHGLAVLRVRFLGVGVALRTTVPETPVKLVCSSRLRAPTVDREIPYSLLPSVDLVTDVETRSLRFAREPLDGHLSERLCLLRTESVLRSSTRVPTRRHRYRAFAS